MAIVVHGGCIEPGGMELDEEHGTGVCPACSGVAHTWFIEAAECGSLNIYSGLACTQCDFEAGNRRGPP